MKLLSFFTSLVFWVQLAMAQQWSLPTSAKFIKANLDFDVYVEPENNESIEMRREEKSDNFLTDGNLSFHNEGYLEGTLTLFYRTSDLQPIAIEIPVRALYTQNGVQIGAQTPEDDFRITIPQGTTLDEIFGTYQGVQWNAGLVVGIGATQLSNGKVKLLDLGWEATLGINGGAVKLELVPGKIQMDRVSATIQQGTAEPISIDFESLKKIKM